MMLTDEQMAGISKRVECGCVKCANDLVDDSKLLLTDRAELAKRVKELESRLAAAERAAEAAEKYIENTIHLDGHSKPVIQALAAWRAVRDGGGEGKA